MDAEVDTGKGTIGGEPRGDSGSDVGRRRENSMLNRSVARACSALPGMGTWPPTRGQTAGTTGTGGHLRSVPAPRPLWPQRCTPHLARKTSFSRVPGCSVPLCLWEETASLSAGRFLP